jgi:23S rRNA (cytosine1962-C5)-methyltransferase
VKKHLVLKKHEERRLLAGHQWVFSNEIRLIEGNPEQGDIVEIHRHDGKFLGLGFFNPHSLIAFRLLTREREEISFEFFSQRITVALALRKRLYPQSETFRLVFGESDFLPGLIIDKFNEFISVQTFSAGMDRRLTLICDVLESLFHPKAIVERNESPLRTLEHLELRKGALRGTLEQTIVTEHEAKFKIDLLNGQKTGFFLDQRENRKTIQRYTRNASVLDAFCNEGGFSIHAALGGAHAIHGIDISDSAIGKAKVNSTINEARNVTFEVADVFETLKKLSVDGKRFDVAILDPPSFGKNKRSIASALRAYKQVNAAALSLIHAGGFLATASCSHHVSEGAFLDSVDQAARLAHRTLQQVERSGASPDHPVLPAMPETEYLKFAIFSVT